MNGSVSIDGVLHVGHEREVVRVPDEIFDQCGFFAARKAVPAHPAFFQVVVVTFSMSPSHSPVENPCHVCGAYSEGCGRPSM